jgi:hypothetical protein
MTMAQRRTKKTAAKPKKKAASKPTGVLGEPNPPSPLRGLLPTPPEVEKIVEEWLKDRPASPQARQRITEDLKMQYYFGGHNIAYRDTP